MKNGTAAIGKDWEMADFTDNGLILQRVNKMASQSAISELGSSLRLIKTLSVTCENSDCISAIIKEADRSLQLLNTMSSTELDQLRMALTINNFVSLSTNITLCNTSVESRLKSKSIVNFQLEVKNNRVEIEGLRNELLALSQKMEMCKTQPGKQTLAARMSQLDLHRPIEQNSEGIQGKSFLVLKPHKESQSINEAERVDIEVGRKREVGDDEMLACCTIL